MSGHRGGSSDFEFMQCLATNVPHRVSALGVEIYDFVRSLDPNGHFEAAQTDDFHFVNRPDNFVTITVRGRAGCIEISLRGRPNHFSGWGKGIELKDGMAGYTRFQVADPADLDAAKKLIKRARRKTNLFG